MNEPRTRGWMISILCMIFMVIGAGVGFADGHMLENFEGTPTLIVYNGGASSVGVTVVSDTVDMMMTNVAEITYNIGDYGGVTVDNPAAADWSDHTGIGFWYNGQGDGASHRVEVKTGAGATAANVSNLFDIRFTDDTAGWQFLEFQFTDLVKRTDFNPGAALGDEIELDAMWGWTLDFAGGSNGTIAIDDVQLIGEAIVPNTIIDDYNDGADIILFADSFDGSGSTTAISSAGITKTTPAGESQALSVTFDVAAMGAWAPENAGYAGLTAVYPATADWDGYDGFGFWYAGTGDGSVHRIEMKVGGDTEADSSRYQYEFTDDTTEWKLITPNFSDFAPRTDFNPGNSQDPIDQTQIWGYSVLFAPGTNGTVCFDDIQLTGEPAGAVKVNLSDTSYSTIEGGSVIVTATLNAASDMTVTVDYGTMDGTGMNGVDYTAVAGMLTFAPGETAQSFTIMTIDNDVNEDDRTVSIALTNTMNAELGALDSATLTIVDDELNLPPTGGKSVLLNDFENDPLLMGTDADDNAVGYEFFQGGASTVAITTTMPPAPRPGADATDMAMAETLFITSGSFAGFTQKLTNDAADAWVSQDWSSYSGMSFWLYGNNSGGVIFIDVLDNRNPDSTTDDAGRYVVELQDNFTGWQYFEFDWTDFIRKDIGNGAPNDGFTLEEINGYAFGGFGSSPMDATYYIDEVRLIQIIDTVADFSGDLPSGTDADDNPVGYYGVAGGGGAINYMTATAPVAIPGFDDTNAALQLDMTLPSNAFAVAVNAFGNEAMDAWTPQDWSNYEGICFWVYGNNTGGILFVDVLDNRNPGSTTDDAERWSVDIPDDFSGWQFFQFTWDDLARKEIGNGAPNDGFDLDAVHGFAFGGFGSVDMGSNTYYVDELTLWGDSGANDPITVQYEQSNYEVVEGESAMITVELNKPAEEDVMVTYSTAESFGVPDRDFIPVSGTVTIPAGQITATITIDTIDNAKDDVRNRNVMVVLYSADGAEVGFQQMTRLIINDNDDPDPNMVNDFELTHPFQTVGNVNVDVTEMMTGDANAIPGQGMFEQSLAVTFDASAETMCLDNMFTQPADWTEENSFTFWFEGTGSGNAYTVQLHDNAAATTAETPSDEWVLAWSDEFNDPAGTPPNPNIWMHEIGDGSLNGIPGWGNSEFQYYTDDPANASTDGNGNMVITLRELGTMPDVVLAQNPSMHPEGIEWDATGQRFLVGSLTMANVFAVADDGAVTPFITSDNLVGGSVGIHIDKMTNRLLVAHSNPNVLAGDPAVTGFAQLGIYDLTTGEELHFVDLTALGASSGRFFANDVTSDADGNAYVTNSESTEIYKVDMDGNAEIFVNNVNANGIEYHPDGYLLAATRSTPGLVNIPLDDPSAMVTVTLSEAARMDGIILNANGDLIGVAKTQIQADGSAEDEIIQLHSDDGWVSAAVVARDTAIPASSPTTVTLRDGIPYVVHANFAGLVTGQVVPEFEIVRVINDEPDLVCYYGPCRYTSARLISQDRAEFEYGRIEARVQVPPGGDGLWPAFWALGTDIREVGWPQTGEIDIMEYVSRVPNEIFGTIHGPGYSGGAAFGNTQNFDDPVAADFHTFTVEWTPDNILWYVDDIQYHQAVPADVAPNEWVFNHPFFLLLNVAIGGNFGGEISEDIVFPQETLVDYVRVYQAANTAERFEATFSDDAAGWQQITIPFDNFTRSAEQPDGAPDDGLTLSAVEGYSIKADGVVGTFGIDQVSVTDAQPTAVAFDSNMTSTEQSPSILIVLAAFALAMLVVGAWLFSRRVH